MGHCKNKHYQQNTFFVILAIIKVKPPQQIVDVTKEDNVPLCDLGNMKGYSSYKKMEIVSKISITCKAFDVSPVAYVFSLIQ